MGDSTACNDCENSSRAEAVKQNTHPGLARLDRKQDPSLPTLRKEAPEDPNSSSVDGSSSDQAEIRCNNHRETEGTAIDPDECSITVNCRKYCSILNSLDSHDTTRYISGDLPTFNNDEASSSSLDSADPDMCAGTQGCFSDQAEAKSLLDVDIDMKICYSPSEKLTEYSTNMPTSESLQCQVGYSSKNFPVSSTVFPVEDFGDCKESNFLFHQRPCGELHGDMQAEATDEHKIIVHNDLDDSHSYLDGLTLDQLDDDVLYHIASFLEARVLRFALSNVCQRFRAMFDCEVYWKMRISHRWPKQFPAVPNPPNFNWIDAYVEREDSYRVWKDAALNKLHFKYSHNLFGGVDTVHLMKEGKLAICGDRSRTLNVVDFSKYSGCSSDEEMMKDMLCHTDRAIHQGWIWSIASAGNQFVTGSWDTYVRLFDVDAGCKLTSSFKCHSSVLCLYAENNETVASCSDKKVYFFDHRTSEVQYKTFHTQPVLCVAGNENYIISGSEDKSVSVYDRRAGKIFIMFKVKNYPFCMSYTDNQLWFGDRNGTLHLHDGTNGLFHNIGSYDIGHTEKMTGVVSSRGAIFTCSGDKTIKVLHPTKDPDPMTTLAVHEKEIAKIDYNNGVLVSAGGDDCLGVWMPKYWDRDTYLL